MSKHLKLNNQFVTQTQKGDFCSKNNVDGWLWSNARASLSTSKELNKPNIDLEVNECAFTLTGTVHNFFQADKPVKNSLKINRNYSGIQH